MPPKRRAPRAAAHKTASPPARRKRASSPTSQVAAAAPLGAKPEATPSEAPSDAILAAEKTTTEASNDAVSSDAAGEEAPAAANDAVLAEERERDDGEPVVSDVTRNDAVLEPRPETLDAGDEGKKDEMVEEGGKDVVFNASNGNDGDTNDNGGNLDFVNEVDGGVKKKKVVKKVVKVVKKVIKKVPKRVPKTEISPKVDNTGDVSRPNSNVVTQEIILDASSDKLDEENGDSCEKKDALDAQNEKKMEADGSEGGSGVKTDDGLVVEEHSAEAMDAQEERENEGGDGNGDMVDVAGQEEVGKLLSGELEAMERKKRRKREVFVGGLDKDAKEDDIRKVFGEVGEIVNLSLVMDSKTGKNKGYAFVRYATAEDAKRALEKFSKVKICGKECSATPVEGNDTIFLGNIDKKWKDDDVSRLLLGIGIEKIDKVIVMIDPNNNQCNRGFAFVEFETGKDAQIAYKKLQKADVFGKNQKIKVAWAEPLNEFDEEEMAKVKTVYAEFLPSSWDEEKVKDVFKKFGEIDNIVLARNLRTTKRKDIAFISYKTREAAIGCIESLSQELRDEDGAKLNVKVSLAKPIAKGKRLKPGAKPNAKETPKKKSTSSSNSNLRLNEPRSRVQPGIGNLRLSEPRSRVQPVVPHYDIHFPERSSTNVELVQLLREQASRRPSHTSFSNSPMDIHYSLSGRKRQFSVLEADPSYIDTRRYPQPRLDASFSVASSSHNTVSQSGVASSLAYHQQHGSYPSGSGSLYGTRYNLNNVEIRDRAHESSILYRRY